MGYLDNSSITVDAILTKQGRKLLAQGQSLNVSYFSLTDAGVDYDLWNVNHPSGTAYYGEAIENLPQPEALPNAQYFMRYKLFTAPKNTVALPLVHIPEGDSYNFGAILTPVTFSPTLLNGTESQGLDVIVFNDEYITVTGGQRVDISGNADHFLAQTDIPSAAMYSFKAGTGIKVTPNITDVQRQTSMIVISKTFGAFKTISLTIEPNQLKTKVLKTN